MVFSECQIIQISTHFVTFIPYLEESNDQELKTYLKCPSTVFI